MPVLVDYPSSDSEPDEPLPPNPPSTSLPPLPPAFHTLYSTNARPSTRDDPTLHHGRKRQVPHVDGNWPTHVYLEWRPSLAESTTLNRLLRAVAAASAHDLTSLLCSELAAPLPLHISLSRSLQIPSDRRDAFLARVTQAVVSSRASAASGPLEVRLDRLLWAANFDRSRWFLALGVARPVGDGLNALLEACNAAAGASGFPLLYGDGAGSGDAEDDSGSKAHPDRSDCFHFSLAWSLTAPDDDSEGLLESVWTSPEAAPAREMRVRFDRVLVKIGNAIHTIDLGSKVDHSHAGLLR